MRPTFALAVLVPLCLIPWAQTSSPSAGEMLYRRGILPSAQPLRGVRKAAGSTETTTEACVNCHRPSGLGTYEGRILVPPIIAKYLFNERSHQAAEMNDMNAATTVLHRKPYNDETLARAIREGISSDGHPLSYLMPRYRLDDQTMTSLIDYLKGLSKGPLPGVGVDTLHFATIITPDADPTEREGMLDVMEKYFESKNHFYRGAAPPLERSSRVHFRVLRKWQLHVWELSGPPETWEDQLRDKLHKEPVFAVISGLGSKTWEPVHRFCQEESLPCMLPNVDLPVVAENDFYDLYYSKGVVLEAQLIANQLKENSGRGQPRRVIQLFRARDIGAEAAEALRTSAPKGLKIENRVLEPGESAAGLAASLKGVGQGDTIVLWLRSKDLEALPPQPVQSPRIYLSATMGGLENAPLPQAWRSVALMAYPFELPALRSARLDYALGWFRIQQIPVVAERIQVNTFIACSIVADSVSSMLDDFVREYLLERTEDMLSPRVVNGYYNRLGLAPGQRFASKGGYIVRFADPTGKRLIAQTEWIVP